MDSNKDKIDSLAAEIRRHNDLYFNKSTPEITDDEFDDLVLQLRALDPENPAIEEVGSTPGYGSKVRHPSTMGSLAKVHTAAEIVAWASKFPAGTNFVVAPKMDGCAVRIEFKDGEISTGATRGNGEEGMDVTANLRAMGLKAPGFSGEVRGEVYMTKEDFAAVNAEAKASGELELANPRNAASGGLNQKDPEVTRSRRLSFSCYGMSSQDDASWTEMSNAQKVSDRNFSFKHVPVKPVRLSSEADVEEFLKSAEEGRPGLPYNIDGLVFSADSISAQEAAGWTGRCPNGKIAYKFRPEQAKAILLDVTWQAQRTGKLTPVAELTPTALDGSMVKRCTVHNIAQVRRLGLTIGAEVVISKMGDIIPGIVKVSKPGDMDVPAPSSCPSCGKPVEEDARGVSLWCHNESCPAKLESRILNFIRVTEMKGIGPQIVSGLCSRGLVKGFADLYRLKAADVAAVTGGQRAAEIVVEAIAAKRRLPLHVFLDALGIRLLGTTMAKALSRGRTLDSVMGITVSDMLAIEGVGREKAISILDGFVKSGPEIADLLTVVGVEAPKAQAGGPLSGKTFLITGTLSKPRKAVEAMIEAAGGTMVSGVSKKLNFLVVGDDPGSKVDKAKAQGVPVIDEKALEGMIS